MNEFAARYMVWPTFGEPLYLVAMVIPAFMLLWAWTRRFVMPSRRVVLPLDGARVGSGWGWWVLITLGECLPALLLAMGIFLLASPQINGPPREKRLLTNIQICVDVSGSMTASYGEGRRYDAAMKAVDKFVDYRKGDAFGLTFFGNEFLHWVPLTSDASAIKCATPFMDPEIAPPAFGGTAIAKALRGCKKELINQAEGDRMILLITDGFSYDLQDAESEIAKEMVDAKITVFAVIAAEFDPQQELMTICRTSGGEAFRADDPDALLTVFKKIDGMKKAKFTPTFVERVDHFTVFAALGLFFLSLASFYGLGLRYTPW